MAGFTSILSVYIPVCESLLFKVTLELPTYKKMFLDQKRYKKHCTFLKARFQTRFFIIVKFHEQITAVGLSKYGLCVCC